MTLLLAQGKVLARHDERALAQGRFARVQALHPDHVDALLWLAALASDPSQSVRYLNRVLEVSPGNRRAIAGLRWARQRLRALDTEPAPAPRRSALPVLDRLLLGGIAVVCAAACILLALVIWDAPAAVRAAYRPTPTYTPTPTLTPTPTSAATPTPTTTATPTAIVTPATSTPTPTPTATRVTSGAPPLTTPLGAKRIVIDLSEQRLMAYEGEELLLNALVSTGVAWYPTPPGEYRIIRRVRSQVMSGPGYYLPNVQFVSYFYRGYAMHGTYWHTNFGHPMSHGCVNLTNEDAQWIWGWAPKGTPVTVRQ